MCWQLCRVSLANTQADLETLRGGVTDLAESFEGKLSDLWRLMIAEIRSEFDHNRKNYDIVHDRRVADHEALDDRFEKLKSAIKDQLIAFDDRIFHMNEQHAGSISMQLQETIRTIKRYPDSLQQLYLGISNFEAHIGMVEQNAANRIEVNPNRDEPVLCTIVSRRLTFSLISLLRELLIVDGLRLGRAIRRSSLLGPIDHGSPLRRLRKHLLCSLSRSARIMTRS